MIVFITALDFHYQFNCYVEIDITVHYSLHEIKSYFTCLYKVVTQKFLKVVSKGALCNCDVKKLNNNDLGHAT